MRRERKSCSGSSFGTRCQIIFRLRDLHHRSAEKPQSRMLNTLGITSWWQDTFSTKMVPGPLQMVLKKARRNCLMGKDAIAEKKGATRSTTVPNLHTMMQALSVEPLVARQENTPRDMLARCHQRPPVRGPKIAELWKDFSQIGLSHHERDRMRRRNHLKDKGGREGSERLAREVGRGQARRWGGGLCQVRKVSWLLFFRQETKGGGTAL